RSTLAASPASPPSPSCSSFCAWLRRPAPGGSWRQAADGNIAGRASLWFRTESHEDALSRTAREHSAHGLPNLTRLLGTVHGLFRQGETPSPLLLTGKNLCFSEAK